MLKIKGTLIVRPTTERCDGKLTRATTLYQVDEVLRGTYTDKTVLVVHRCPEIPRGPSRYGRGDAGALQPGQLHVLTLEPIKDLEAVKALVDPFDHDKRPRYKAHRTNRGSYPPRIVVTVQGGAGTSYKLAFDARSVLVGRSSSADVMLSDADVAQRHLRLRVAGDKIEVLDLGGIRINGKRPRRPQKVTFRDKITFGPYVLRVSLFLRLPSGR
jgi:Inner membrane component of T3SS, cytoplasmic domain